MQFIVTVLLGIIAILLGIIGIRITKSARDISKDANKIAEDSKKIAKESGQIIAAMANLEFDMILAEMAGHIAWIKREAGDNKIIYFTKKVRDNLWAASQIKEYFDQKKKQQMVRHVITIVETIIRQPEYLKEKDVRSTLRGIITTAKKFDVDQERLNSLLKEIPEEKTGQETQKPSATQTIPTEPSSEGTTNPTSRGPIKF